MSNRPIPKHDFDYSYNHGEGENETNMGISEKIAAHRALDGPARRSFDYNYQHGAGQNRTEMDVRDGYDILDANNGRSEGRPSFKYRYSHGKGANRTVMKLRHARDDDDDENIPPPYRRPPLPTQSRYRNTSHGSNERDSIEFGKPPNNKAEQPRDVKARSDLNERCTIESKQTKNYKEESELNDSDCIILDRPIKTEHKQKVYSEPRSSNNQIVIQQKQNMDQNPSSSKKTYINSDSIPHFNLPLPKNQNRINSEPKKINGRRRTDIPIVNKLDPKFLIEENSTSSYLANYMKNLKLENETKSENGEKGIDFNYEHEDGNVRTRISISQIKLDKNETTPKRPSKSVIKDYVI